MEYGLLTINWAKRELTLEGIAGDAVNALSYGEVKARLKAHEAAPAPDTEVYGMIAWERDETGGHVQLALHETCDNLRDSAGIYENDDPDDDQGEEP
jgi:hypothetical protein